ncbi:M20/M25/M40 family metallo-hydrolase [Breznakia pachnodae]|uniref:Tripeptide aminopeptidase n=1 Tax=Breznakia pachnodae TaxID=265178 RepID=A0ABU0E5U6_9FIRM|nr:M20/M25/M40 family metallo-hydrolase [Breznakia pachnodae]MDQ0361880.1 tripeptide aminopeptidase [Breznakia pachnodae]
MKNKRLINNFSEMVEISSVSKFEGTYHEYLKKLFQELGCEMYEDNTQEKTGLGGNNLVFTLSGKENYEPIFFSCHTDTVEPGENIKVAIDNDIIYSAGDTILAADNKAGIAALIEAIKQLKEQNLPHGTIEIILSPGEEIGLIGSQAFDVSKLKSNYGYVLDSAGKVGNITIASPTLIKMNFQINGKSAHAGLEPEKGVSAITIAANAIAKIKTGRLDSKTTVNVGTIKGGVATNVVADKTVVELEIRSISHDTCLSKEKEIRNTFEDMTYQLGGTIDVESNILCEGYEFNVENTVVKKALEAVRHIGRQPEFEISGGGSDANSFNTKGKETLNLSIGYEKIHTTEEYIPISELQATVDLVLALVQNQTRE